MLGAYVREDNVRDKDKVWKARWGEAAACGRADELVSDLSASRRAARRAARAAVAVAVDAATAVAAEVFGLGLKSWAATKIDTVKDGECILETKPGFATMRMPDSIAAFTLDGKDYLLFAEEGDDYTYGDFEDKQTAVLVHMQCI